MDERLRRFMVDRCKGGVIVSFSGGVDSSTLAFICNELLDDVIAVTVVSEVMPSYELEDAVRIAKEIGLRHQTIELEILSHDEFARNTVDRCYFCKKMMVRKIKEFAREVGIDTIFDGTNASDLNEVRPGYRALVEEGVCCPWVELGITKDEIVEIARRMGLSFYNKPPNTCLATRIPYNERITIERLKRIERAEEILRNVGFGVLRVRDHGEIARIEVGRDERSKFFDVKVMDWIVEELTKLGYRYVTLDLHGYR